MTRLSDEQIAAFASIILPDPLELPAAHGILSLQQELCVEIRELRAQKLTDEDFAALQFARDIVSTDTCAMESAFRGTDEHYEALAVLDKLLARKEQP